MKTTNRRPASNNLLLIAAFSVWMSPTAMTSRSNGEWNQWRGPSRDGKLSVSLPEDLDGRLELVWQQSLGPSYSGPVTNGGLVFTTETVQRQKERVTAYRIDSGELVWEVEWDGAMAVPFFAAANGDWIRSTPVCVPGHLVVLGMRDVLVSLNPETGAENWRVDFPKQMQTPLQSFGAVCSPLIHDGHVFVQVGGGLTKLDLETGNVEWRALGGSGDMMSGGAFSSPVVATIAGEKQLVVQTRQELCGVNLDSGEVLWSEPIEAFRGMNILTPLVVGDAIFTAAHSGRSQLFDITKSDQEWKVTERWNQNKQGYMSSPVEIDGTIYLHAKDERVVAMSMESGEKLWSSRPVGKYWSVLHNGEKLLSLNNRGELRLIRANNKSFDVLGTANVAEDSWAHVAMENDRVIVRDLKSLRVYSWGSNP